MLGGSWLAISRVISPLIKVRSIVTLVIARLITTHEPPSESVGVVSVFSVCLSVCVCVFFFFFGGGGGGGGGRAALRGYKKPESGPTPCVIDGMAPVLSYV